MAIDIERNFSVEKLDTILSYMKNFIQIQMSLVVRKPVFGVFVFSTRSNTNQAVQPHKMARSLKFRIQEVEGLYYLCFRICKNPVFSRRGSNVKYTCTGLSTWLLVNPRSTPKKVLI